jgi:serine/threonine-protein kinase
MVAHTLPRLIGPTGRLAAMAETALDRNLLFGVVALQMQFVSRDALLGAIRAWVADEQKSLDQVLVERGILAEDERALLEPLVGQHLENHSADAQRSVAELSSVSWIKHGPSLARNPVAITADPSTTGVSPTMTRAPAPVRPSLVAGRYDILRSHARGGLGEVFVARDRELGREVALKQIQPQFADDALSRARFVREAEITGGLEHPGVVPVHALGWDGHGRPYYAMRFIRGESLKEAVERFHAVDRPESAPGQRSLELRRLVRQFLDVCNAIDYAHSRGVVHRDIKPSNIVVGMHGETLVVDWGLAKTLGRTDSGDVREERSLVPSSVSESAQTLPGLAQGTPSFMSPEQAAGALERIGLACDVYSLGATLYCLITGRAPFESDSVQEVLRAVREGVFPPPRQVDRLIPRALEAICLRAMALEPRDRYPTARALAEDIERWMADEPVSARREPMAERIVRAMRRRRTTVTAAAAAMLVALVGSVVVLTVQAQANHDLAAANDRERARFDLAMESIQTFHASVSEDLMLREPQFQELRAKLLRGAREFSLKLESLLKGDSDPRSRLALGRAYDELAALTDKIGSKPEALELYRHELGLCRELARGSGAGSPVLARAEVARCLLALGRLQYQTGHPDEAMTSYQEARILLEGLDRSDAAPHRRSERATCYHQIGELLAATGRPVEAMEWYQKGRSARAAMVQDHPSEARLASDLAESDNAIGILHWSSGRPAPAVESFAKARAALETIARERPTDTEYRRRLASGYNAMGYPLHAIGKTDQALHSFEAARDILGALVQDNPALTEFRRQLAYSHAQIGTLLWDTGRPARALAPYEKARALLETLVQANPAVDEIRNDLARCYSQLGHVYLAIGQPTEALVSCERARALREALVLANPSLAAYRSDLAVTLGVIGTVKQAAGQFTAAGNAFRQAIGILDNLPAPGPDDYYNLACYHARLAGLAGASGSGIAAYGAGTEADRAIEYLRRAAATGFRMLSLMATDRDLDPIRSRPDFQILMMDLTFPQEPFVPRSDDRPGSR